jgi:hypothetical protein
VLEHIGMVAGVKGVTIAEHGRAMCARNIRRNNGGNRR